ncbi:hypothetical protein GCM10009841_11000 [Microlunatus panaciterrae]|uniref:Murein DD-endopeptidase MepM/ murein hydrolase activator NlpD n=1 Tax=Microlunatus panaciterrae TaxID=400768 RepID=A0ABS2RMC4_9ACTN|nr:M23 family metallopeptidase [Microlunatus panaciterrae]MBM7799657.1 murein DD-endopeptidase MepM/ murein hydrolase activator NlpD [Microlunatus panaciterrae]
MLRSFSGRSQPRRALIEDVAPSTRAWDRKGWLQHGIAALAVSALGLGVAGSLVLTGNAQHTAEAVAVQKTVAPGVAQPSAFERRDTGADTSRGVDRPALDSATVAEQAQKRAIELNKATAKTSKAAQQRALAARAKELRSEQAAAKKNAAKLAQRAPSTSRSRAGQNGTAAATRPANATGGASLPITSGYSVAARFGQVGAWARYHTGFDFATPVGTPVHAPASGVVTNAGPGSASGWAGTYITIRHSDGTSTLYAHLSSVSVSVGQSVSGGQLIGHVGMTGRTFGPHLHFEVYPAGVTPGDVYRAINPEPWLRSRGLNP